MALMPPPPFSCRIPSNAWTLAQGAVLRRLYAAPQAPLQQSAAVDAPEAAAVDAASPVVDDAPATSEADSQLSSPVAALLSAAAAARAAGKLDQAAGLLAQALAGAPQHALTGSNNYGFGLLRIVNATTLVNTFTTAVPHVNSTAPRYSDELTLVVEPHGPRANLPAV